jgi:hypothetical protein
MPVESAADRASFLSADEFATPALYTAPGGGDAIGPFTIVYDRGQAKNRFVAQDLRASTAERSAWLRADDVAVLARGGLIEIGHLGADGSVAVDGDGAMVVDETLEVAGLPMLDETGCFWFAELLIVTG